MFEFRGVDFMEFDSLLSEEELMVRQTARQFVEDRFIPQITQHFRDGTFPNELTAPIAELGFFGANLEGYGCAGLSNVEYGLVMQELERGDSALRSFVSVQSSLAMYAIYSCGSDEQKERWLPKMQQGQVMGCFALTEPNFGSNPSGMLTRAVRDGHSYVLNGEKTWITNGSLADLAVVWAKLEDSDRIQGFLVETDTPGFTAVDLHNKLSMRASTTSSVGLSNVRIPAGNILPDGKGLKAALGCLTNARLGIAWGTIGAAMACYDCARQYTILRTQFDDRPIASHQLVQNELAWMITEITKAQFITLQVTRLKDKGRQHHAHVSMIKRNNAAIALEVARRARDLLGANGITDEYPIFRHMCNLETVKTYEGTHNIHTLILGSHVTGIQAF
ncbi:MAG: acyl-CoA dehydrogenase family protein, partial [Bryobacterales bacterium]|nr:acyl-CoA dehydrogenase family protein [Bryobacterales bacterium]